LVFGTGATALTARPGAVTGAGSGKVEAAIGTAGTASGTGCATGIATGVGGSGLGVGLGEGWNAMTCAAASEAPQKRQNWAVPSQAPRHRGQRRWASGPAAAFGPGPSSTTRAGEIGSTDAACTGCTGGMDDTRAGGADG
jgi:hypothetical protein